MVVMSFIFLTERRAHVPLGAGSSVTHGVKVVITGNHLNETAPSGYVARLVVPSLFCLLHNYFDCFFTIELQCAFPLSVFRHAENKMARNRDWFRLQFTFTQER
jgi:hypothetical protein